MSRSIYAPILFSLGFGFIGAFIVLFTPANASAASDFDDVIQPTVDLSVTNERALDGTGYTITDIYKNLFTGIGDGGHPYNVLSSCSGIDLVSTYNSAVSSGSYYISQVNTNLSFRDTYSVVFGYSSNPDIDLVFYSTASGSQKSLIVPGAHVNEMHYFVLDVMGTGGSYPEGSIYLNCVSGNAFPSTVAQFLPNEPYYSAMPFKTNMTIQYPEGYEGSIIGEDAPEQEILTPEYTWSINGETGELKVVYMKNISPFLTGTSYTVLEGMQPEFESPLTAIDSQSHLPAGWLDYSYTLQPGEGWYSLRIDHNQQLDEPPWDYSPGMKPRIEQQFFQIYWDGKSSISGNNIGGCEGQICNNLRDTGSNKLTRFMNQLSFNTFGLESIIILPINYLAQTSSLVDSCQPIHVPFVAGSDFNIPCLRSTYMNAIPVLMGTVFVLINGLVMYLVAINTLRLVKNTADPDHDRIETTDL